MSYFKDPETNQLHYSINSRKLNYRNPDGAYVYNETICGLSIQFFLSTDIHMNSTYCSTCLSKLAERAMITP